MNTVPPGLTRGGLGKLPHFSEFVQVDASNREALVLEDWLRAGLRAAQRAFGAEWVARYDSRLYHRFIFRPGGSDHTLVGILRAATDAYERRFPFTIFEKVPTRQLETFPQWLPFFQDTLFPELEATLEHVAQSAELSQVRERLEARTARTWPLPSSQQRYDAFLDEVRCRDLCGSRPDAVALFEELLAVMPPNAGTLRTLPEGLEVPLRQPAYARGLELRFWTELCLALLGPHAPPLSLFWPTSAVPTRDASMLICLRQPTGPLMAALLGATETSTPVWRPGCQKPVPGLSRELRAPVPFEPDSSLRSLLRALSHESAPNRTPGHR